MFLRVFLISACLLSINFHTYAYSPEACNETLIEKAESGETVSQAFLAWCYSEGHGFKKDKKEAFKWYSKAAIAGHSVAQNNLGTMLLIGNPYKKNEPLAAQWYMQSAMQGNAQAQYNIAALYRQGIGVHRNYAAALKWYQEAAYQNHAFAMDALAYMHEKGLGMDGPNEQKAAYWRKHASLAKNPKNRNPWKE